MSGDSDLGPFTICTRAAFDAMEATDLRTYLALAFHADKTNGECYPSRPTLAGMVGCSLRTLDRSVARLVESGWLKKRHQKTTAGDHDRNLYTVRFMPPVGVASPLTLPGVTGEPRGSVTGEPLTRTSENHNHLPPAAPEERERDEVWDALVAAFWEPVTAGERKRIGRITASLKRAGATGRDVRRRCAAWDEHWRPDGKGSAPTLTPEALEKHWQALGQTAGVGNGERMLTIEEMDAIRESSAREQAERTQRILNGQE